MTNVLIAALSGLEVNLERLGRRTLMQALQPGIGSDEVGMLLEGAGLPSDECVEALYSWRNGTQTTDVTIDEIAIFPGFYLLSLEDAVITYRTMAVAGPRWDAVWLPVFADGGGDYYVVELGGQSSGWVRHFQIDELEHPYEFRSLTEMVVTLAAAFDQNVFIVDSDGYLEMNDLRFVELVAELNPEMPR